MIHVEDAYKVLMCLTWKDDTVITISEIIQKCIKQCEDLDYQNCEIHYRIAENKIADTDYRVTQVTVRNDCQQIDIYIEPTGYVPEMGGSCVEQDEDIV